jgi:hypothetical protein
MKNPNSIAYAISAALLAVTLALCAGGPAASRPLVSTNDWTGLWRGRYVCAQGATGLILTVRKAGGGNVTAVFKFFALPENPGVPPGEFEMAGRPGPQRNHLQLFPSGWIKEPSGYVMVGLDGDYNESTGEYSGRVTHPSCSQFILHRDLVI